MRFGLSLRNTSLVFITGTALLLCGGCSTYEGLVGTYQDLVGGNKPKAWNVTIIKKTPATIRVDLVGIRKVDRAEWAGRNITEYWQSGSKVRKEADKLPLEKLVKDEPLKVSAKDAKWEQWFERGVDELLIIADLPGSFSGTGEDPRRKFLPLGPGDWKPAKKNTLEIWILETAIRPMTPQNINE